MLTDLAPMQSPGWEDQGQPVWMLTSPSAAGPAGSVPLFTPWTPLTSMCSFHFHPNPKPQEQFSHTTGGNVPPIPMEPALGLKRLPFWAGRTECS